jgi:hypothetical protein
MFNMFTNLTKAALAVAVLPLDVLADVACLPATALEGEDPWDFTGKRMSQVSAAFNKAVE